MQNWLANVNRPKQLFVEGQEEVLFLGAFLRALGINDVQIQNCRGKDNLGPILLEIADGPDFQLVNSIGIVRDADNSYTGALQSVQSALRSAGITIPEQSAIPAPETLRVSVFIMPDNSSTGALEQLCLSALANDPAMPCVEEFLTCVNSQLTDPPKDQQKARVHAFLASRQDPELRLGEAAQRGYIPLDDPAFTDLAQFLHDL